MRAPILVEACVDSVESALAAARGGAHRIELCASLVEGGTTPSAGTLAVCRARLDIPIFVLIRPRGGDFLYSAAELAVMLEDIGRAKEAGAHGVVTGALRADGEIDADRTRELIAAARPLRVTFHRAFDVCRDAGRALETLIALGVDRVLTSGQAGTAPEGVETIARAVRPAVRPVIVQASFGGACVESGSALMPPRPYILNELTWKDVRDARYEVAVLPWGACEPHNRHLPYSTDNVETERIADLSARIAWERGARVVVLPVVPFGVNTGQLDLPLCLNMNPSTQALVLRDVATALAGQGVPKLVILNGHGGNDFRQMIRELQPAVSLFLCLVNWYQVVDPKAFFADLGDHAGELETSVMLHLAPDLVRPLSEAGPGAARHFTIAGLREGWAWAPRQWRRVTDDTGVGNPAAATSEKGRRYVDAVSAKIAAFLVELAGRDAGEMYE